MKRVTRYDRCPRLLEFSEQNPGYTTVEDAYRKLERLSPPSPEAKEARLRMLKRKGLDRKGDYAAADARERMIQRKKAQGGK